MISWQCKGYIVSSTNYPARYYMPINDFYTTQLGSKKYTKIANLPAQTPSIQTQVQLPTLNLQQGCCSLATQSDWEFSAGWGSALAAVQLWLGLSYA
jgi:hypothetical protein